MYNVTFKHWIEESMTSDDFKKLSMPLKKSLRRSYVNMKIDMTYEVNNCTPESRYKTASEVLRTWKITLNKTDVL